MTPTELEHGGINRRLLLTRAGLFGAAGIIPGAVPYKGLAAMQADDGTPATPAPIALDLLSGDVWVWIRTISGTCPGIPEGAAISLMVNEEPVATVRVGDVFHADVPLEPGRNTILAVASLGGGKEVRSEAVTHTLRLTPRPIARIAANVVGGRITLDGSTSEPSEYDAAPIISRRWSLHEMNPAPFSIASDEGIIASPVASPMADKAIGADRVTATIPARDGEYYISLEVGDDAGRTDTATVCIVVTDGTARVMNPVVEEAAWVQDAIVYGMVVRNFTSGGFAGVASRLDELVDLGVTALWFAPITGTPEGDFGYAVTDYFNVRSEYGTFEDFRALVGEAHARGIRVLMDFVPNHTSSEHPYFRHAEEWGKASPYYDFYDRDGGGTPTHYFSWDHLPNLNFESPGVRRFMTEAFLYWVREFDVDGFRVDVAWGIKERRPEYWLEWSAELNRIKPDLLLIAEASARDPFYVQNGFDAAYNWTDELGVWAWGEVFANGFPLSRVMPEALNADGEGYHPDSLILHFLNNNDTGMRFVSVYGVNRYRAALVLLMTLPGIPCLYTGDEIGAQFQPYENPEKIDWNDANGIRPFVTRLAQLRHEHPAFRSRAWSQIQVEPAVEMFGYLRPADGDASIGVILNYSPNDLDATITLPPELSGAPLIDHWNNEHIPVTRDRSLTLPVPAWGFRILRANTAGSYRWGRV